MDRRAVGLGVQDSLVRLVPDYKPAPDIRRASLLHVASRFDIEHRYLSPSITSPSARPVNETDDS